MTCLSQVPRTEAVIQEQRVKDKDLGFCIGDLAPGLGSSLLKCPSLEFHIPTQTTPLTLNKQG